LFQNLKKVILKKFFERYKKTYKEREKIYKKFKIGKKRKTAIEYFEKNNYMYDNYNYININKILENKQEYKNIKLLREEKLKIEKDFGIEFRSKLLKKNEY